MNPNVGISEEWAKVRKKHYFIEKLILFINAYFRNVFLTSEILGLIALLHANPRKKYFPAFHKFRSISMF